MRVQGRSDSIESYAVSEEDEDAFQALGHGVLVRTPDLKYGSLEASTCPVFEPARQPRQPPPEDLQQIIGFAKFLKEHASPPTKRVTAGGRIVAVGPRSPPPTFQVEHIDTVLKEAEEKRRLQESQALWLRMRNENQSNGSRKPVGKTTQAFCEPLSLQAEAMPADEQVFGNVRVPTSFKLVETIDKNAVVVKAGNSLLYASVKENGQTSYQTVALNAQSQWPVDTGSTDQRPDVAMYGQDGAHPPSASCTSQSISHLCTSQQPNISMLPGGQEGCDYEVAQTQQDIPFAMYQSETTAHESLTSNSTAETSVSYHAPSATNGMLGLANGASIGQGQTSLQPSKFDIDAAAELNRVTTGFEEQSRQLRDLERHLALNDIHMEQDEYQMHMRRKHLLIESKDQFRRKKEHLESMQEAKLQADLNFRYGLGCALGAPVVLSTAQTAPNNLVVNQQPAVKPDAVRSKKPLSPTAPSFVPFSIPGNLPSLQRFEKISGMSVSNMKPSDDQQNSAATVLRDSAISEGIPGRGPLRNIDPFHCPHQTLDRHRVGCTEESCTLSFDTGNQGSASSKHEGTGTNQPTFRPKQSSGQDRGVTGQKEQSSARHAKQLSYLSEMSTSRNNAPRGEAPKRGPPVSWLRGVDEHKESSGPTAVKQNPDIGSGEGHVVPRNEPERRLPGLSDNDRQSLVGLPGFGIFALQEKPKRMERRVLSPSFHGERIIPVRGTKAAVSNGMNCSLDMMDKFSELRYERAQVANKLRSQLSNSEPTVLRGGYISQRLVDEAGDEDQDDWDDETHHVARTQCSGRLTHFDPKTQAVSLYKSSGAVPTRHGAEHYAHTASRPGPWNMGGRDNGRASSAKANNGARDGAPAANISRTHTSAHDKLNAVTAPRLATGCNPRFQALPLMDFNVAMTSQQHF